MKSKGGGQEWFYHAPAPRKKEEKILAPPTSQIPGLSADDKEAMDRETGTNKRNLLLKDTDSKYIQLAKQGGRKNLLSFMASRSGETKEPKPYARVDWFDHEPMTVEDEKRILAERRWNPPEYMVHEAYCEDAPQEAKPAVNFDLGEALKERRNIQNKYETRNAPFDTDDKSVWRRQHDALHNPTPPKQYNANLPDISKKASDSKDGVEFSKLLSGGYGHDWIKTLTKQQRSQIKKWEKQNKGLNSGRYNLTEYQQSISHRELPTRKLKPINYTHHTSGSKLTVKAAKTVDKPAFKLSKFANVKSRLATSTSSAT